jgi:serine protease inhibitor ecotin
MKKMFLAALTVLSLSAAIAPLANAQTLTHSGPYDNTANSLNRNVIGGQ